jgi:hypothetical protein
MRPQECDNMELNGLQLKTLGNWIFVSPRILAVPGMFESRDSWPVILGVWKLFKHR